jgi:hypothetical protein
MDGARITGCCIYNWHIEDLDLSKVDCRYIFTQFNYQTKSPTERYPAGRELEPGELGRQYQQDGPSIEVYFTEPPNWQALAFTLAQLELESHELNLTIKSYERVEDNYLLRLAANRLVNAKVVIRRIFQIYPEIFQRLLSKRAELFQLLDIDIHSKNLNLALEPPPQPEDFPPKPLPSADRRERLYQEVVRQIQHIMMSQAPEQFVESVQNLLNFLDRQGISTEEIQKKIIGQVIAQRAKRDRSFRDHLLRWEKTATESARLSTVGQAVRLAIALLWTQSQQS